MVSRGLGHEFLNNQESFNFANPLDGDRSTALKSVIVSYEVSGCGRYLDTAKALTTTPMEATDCGDKKASSCEMACKAPKGSVE